MKSTYQKLWELEPELLSNVCSHPFRHREDVSQYVLREYQKLSGEFVPENVQKICGYYDLKRFFRKNHLLKIVSERYLSYGIKIRKV